MLPLRIGREVRLPYSPSLIRFLVYAVRGIVGVVMLLLPRIRLAFREIHSVFHIRCGMNSAKPIMYRMASKTKSSGQLPDRSLLRVINRI